MSHASRLLLLVLLLLLLLVLLVLLLLLLLLLLSPLLGSEVSQLSATFTMQFVAAGSVMRR